ncbi:hypothetical protein HUU40_26325 [candidate division KSB1 bacterium]|nr:hypothetical protein [candidate division KSB1 bacterium]
MAGTTNADSRNRISRKSSKSATNPQTSGHYKKLASELLYTRETFHKSDSKIPGEFAQIATFLVQASEDLKEGLSEVLAFMKVHYGKAGGRKKKSEQISLHYLVHDVMKYCGITLYEAGNRIEWFLPNASIDSKTPDLHLFLQPRCHNPTDVVFL